MKNERKSEIQQMLQEYFYKEISEEKKMQCEKILKSRIRPVLDFLIETGDIQTLEKVENQGWISRRQLDQALEKAGTKGYFTAFVWLLKRKKEKYGFTDKDYSL